MQSATPTLPLTLRMGSGRGLQRRLYEALRDAILSGRLPRGARLPASRALAEEFGIARQTVVLVYERLTLEGYLSGKVGAGTFVSGALQGGAPPAEERDAAALPHSTWAARAAGTLREPVLAEPPQFDFRPGVPDWASFPHTQWRRLLGRRWRGAEGAPGLGQYGDPAGDERLRQALAAYLARSRGLRCSAEEVLIVSGSQQALDLLSRVCLDSGDVAAVEEPGYPPACAILSAAGARLRPVPVDEQGLVVAALRDAGVLSDGSSFGSAPPKLVYVTPSHQYPTGATLSLARRLELLEWAAQHGALVVEDDYESELRYAGPPLPALQGLDERRCVAYVGSCSSVLFPPLRVGWIVAPPALMSALVAAKWLADRQTSTLDQQVLADFIDGGGFARHLRRSRALYGARRAALARAVERHLPAACHLAGEAAGLQTPLLLPDGTDEAALVTAAAAYGVGVYPMRQCYARRAAPSEAAPPPGLLMGFAAVPEPVIDEGIRRLALAL